MGFVLPELRQREIRARRRAFHASRAIRAEPRCPELHVDLALRLGLVVREPVEQLEAVALVEPRGRRWGDRFGAVGGVFQVCGWGIEPPPPKLVVGGGEFVAGRGSLDVLFGGFHRCVFPCRFLFSIFLYSFDIPQGWIHKSRMQTVF